jgi:predicted transposase/invertase (TIGR01784 family)
LAYSEQKGREERNIEIAKSMKVSSYDLSEIARITGLSVEEIEKL